MGRGRLVIEETTTSDEIITDVSTALITNDSAWTKEIMEKYNAEYVFVTRLDVEAGIFCAINIGAYGTEKVHVGSDEYYKTILVGLWSEEALSKNLVIYHRRER